MNRLKLWLFALVVTGLAAFGLYTLTVELGRQGLEATDRQLRAAEARVEAAERAATSQLAAVAAVAAQDPKLATALQAGAEAPSPEVKPARKAPPPPAAPSVEQLDAAVDQAAAEAVTAALAVSGVEKQERVVLAMSREGLQRKLAADAEAAVYLRDAERGVVWRGYAVLGDKLHAGAVVPVRDRGALAVFVPADPAWVTEKLGRIGDLAAVLGADKARTVVAGKPENPALLLRLAPRAFALAPSGTLAPVDLTPAWLPVKLPPVRSLLSRHPAERVVARKLPGLQAGTMVLALPTAPALETAVRVEWYGLAGLALVLLLAIPFSLLVKPTEVAAALPPILLEAARKIEKGDFSVRAPVLAGKLGTLAAALNKAVDAAQSVPQTPVESVTSEFFNRQPQPAEPAADLFAMPIRPPRSAPAAAPAPAEGELLAGEDTARVDGANLSGAAFEAAPVAAPKVAPGPGPGPAPTPAPTPAPAPLARPVPAPVPAPAADLLAGAARAASGADPGEEEQHWREIFRDFVRTRAECGESAEGLTYERFRQKLESNKSALVNKYGCKTVRFQVYVKDGKAALKATPVR